MNEHCSGITRRSILGIGLLVLGWLSISIPATAGRHTLTVAHSAQYPPYAYLDEEGTPHGYLIDLWNAFGKANNMDIRFKLGSWQESMDMVRDAEADIHGGLFFNEERDVFLDFGPTIMDLTTHLYVRNGLSTVEADTCLVGVVKGGFSEHFMRKERPGRAIITYESSHASIKAAKAGSIDAFIADRPTGIHHMRQLGIIDDFSSKEMLYSNPLRGAVREGDTVTLDIIMQGWPKIAPATVKIIEGKWFVDKTETADWITTGVVISVLTLVAALIIRSVFRRMRV